MIAGNGLDKFQKDASDMKYELAWNLSDLENIPKNGLKVFSTFSGGGGSSMGYKLAGFDVIAVNDIDPKMEQHYRMNLNPKNYFLCPIKELLEMELPEELYNIDILDGSPPCTTFSLAGKLEEDWCKCRRFAEGQKTQILSELFFDFINLVKKIKPKVVVAENVIGIITGNAKYYAQSISHELTKIGYDVQVFKIKSEYCEVPQARHRVFFCAIRSDISHTKLAIPYKNLYVLSVGSAIQDCSVFTDGEMISTKLSAQLEMLYDHVKPGKSFEDATIKVLNKRSNFTTRKLDETSPASTLLVNSYSLVHYKENRKLTLREMIRIASFPDDYEFKSYSQGAFILGMSVPPKMMQVVANAIYNQWFLKKACSDLNLFEEIDVNSYKFKYSCANCSFKFNKMYKNNLCPKCKNIHEIYDKII